MMSASRRIKEGDILAIPICSNIIAVGLVLHVSKLFKEGMMVGYFETVFSSINEISVEKLGGNFIDIPNYTSVKAVTKGPWKIVGNSQELLDAATIPLLRVATSIYFKDSKIKHFQSNQMEEAMKYPLLKGQGRGFVENKLRDHLELPR